MQMQSICIAGTPADCRHHRNALLVREEWGQKRPLYGKELFEIRSAAAGKYNSQNSLVSLPALLNGREARCYRGVIFVVMRELDALRVNAPLR